MIKFNALGTLLKWPLSEIKYFNDNKISRTNSKSPKS